MLDRSMARHCTALYVPQFRAKNGALPDPGDMGQAEAVFELAKACNEEDGGFKAEGLDDSKVRGGGSHIVCLPLYLNV